MMERSVVQRSIPALLIALLFAGTVFLAFYEIGFGEARVDDDGSVTERIIENGTEETGSANLVTSVVLNYRGFDTLGEVTVLFLAASGAGALISLLPRERARKKTSASLILDKGSRLVLPLIVLFGVYVFAHGHLSPGGGFQGGVIIASGLLLYLVSREGARIGHGPLAILESTAGLSFVGLGLIGLAVSGIFLDNVIYGVGEVGLLVSAGLLPLIYVAIGVKVGTELTGLVKNMRGDVV